MQTTRIRRVLFQHTVRAYGLHAVMLAAFLMCQACGGDFCAADESAVATTVAARRILQTRCVSCHGADKQEGGLRLDSAESLHKGGDRAATMPSTSESLKLLLLAISWEDADLQMPPG